MKSRRRSSARWRAGEDGEGEITLLNVEPAVGSTPPWAGVTPAPGIKKDAGLRPCQKSRRDGEADKCFCSAVCLCQFRAGDCCLEVRNMAGDIWRIEGEYFESCNCEFL